MMHPVLNEVVAELARAQAKFPAMRSAHEGHSIIREEFEELWAEVKKRDPDPAAMRREALQLAAMALRFVVDVIDRTSAEEPIHELFIISEGARR